MPRRHSKTLSSLRGHFFGSLLRPSGRSSQLRRKRPIRWWPIRSTPTWSSRTNGSAFFEEHLGPHETMPMHQHPAPGAVIVFLTDRNNRLTYFDGTVKDFSKPRRRRDLGGAHHSQIGKSHRRAVCGAANRTQARGQSQAVSHRKHRRGDRGSGALSRAGSKTNGSGPSP